MCHDHGRLKCDKFSVPSFPNTPLFLFPFFLLARTFDPHHDLNDRLNHDGFNDHK